MKIRPNPFFPQSIKELANALGVYWRELSLAINSLSCITCKDGNVKTNGVLINSPDGTEWLLTIDNDGLVSVINPYIRVDEDIANVVLLMHMDDDFVDATGNHTFSTIAGTPAFATGQFDKAGAFTSDAIACSASSDFLFGTDPFTIEFWFKSNLLTSNRYFMGMPGDADQRAWIYTFGTELTFYGFKDGPVIQNITTGTWYHVAISGEGGASGPVHFFVNGVLKITRNIQYAQTGTVPLEIGAAYTTTGSAEADVLIDELRITKGVARYTEAFTPPTEPFPDP